MEDFVPDTGMTAMALLQTSTPLASAAPAPSTPAPARDTGRRPSFIAWLVALWLVALLPTALLVLNALDILDPTLLSGARAAGGDAATPHAWQRAAVAGFWASLALVLTTALARRIVVHVRRDVRAVDAQRQAAQSQRDEETTFIEHAPCGYHALDGAGRVVRVNHTELAWLGRDANDVLGHPFTDFLTPEAAERYREATRRPAEGESPHELEVELVRPGGEPLPVLLRTRPAPPGSHPTATSVGVAVDFSRHRDARTALERLTRLDPLTELGNRRDFFERAEQEFARSRRHAEPLSLLALDIDHFKRVNDTLGHPAGDDVLRHVGRLLRQSLRSIDIIGRLGGEEFAVLMPATDLATAKSAAERLRETLETNPAPCGDGAPIPCTVSVGVSTLTPWTSGVRDLLRKADLALYEAKRGGRNQVRAAG